MERRSIITFFEVSQYLITSVHFLMSAVTSRKKFKRKRCAIQKFLLSNPALTWQWKKV